MDIQKIVTELELASLWADGPGGGQAEKGFQVRYSPVLQPLPAASMVA